MGKIATTPEMSQLEILALELIEGGLKVRKDFHDAVERIISDPTCTHVDGVEDRFGPESDLYCGSTRCWSEIFDHRTGGAARYSVRATMLLAWYVLLYRRELEWAKGEGYGERRYAIQGATERLREAILAYVMEEQRIGHDRAELDEEQVDLDAQQRAAANPAM